MTLSAMLNLVRDALEPWTKTKAGAFKVARDPWQPYEIMSAGSKGIIVSLGWIGERVVDAGQHSPLAAGTIELVLGAPMGLTQETDANLHRPVGDRPAVVDLVDELIAEVSKIAIPGSTTTAHFFEYLGTEPLTLPNGVRLAAYRLTFQVTRIVLTPHA